MSALEIGDYLVDGELGSGTAGTAYRGHHRKTNAAVAIKLLSQEMSREETMQRRFIREMAVMSKLHHKNIVRYVQGGLHEDRFFYVMELVDCSSLKEVLANRHTLSWQEATECGIQICDALQCAHEAGVIHRDLKPANLFLSSDGLIKLGDFGLARDLSQGRLTTEGLTVGTCRYMSPEQISGEGELKAATDLYALGCLLYEMITGSVPFNGTSTFEILDQHFSAPPPDARAEAPSCPAALAELIQQLLAKSVAERPSDARAVKERLTDIRTAQPIHDGVEHDEQVPPRNLTERLHSGPQADHREVPWLKIAAISAAILVLVVVAAMLPDT